MKIPLTILAVVAVILVAFELFAPAPGPDALQARTDLPWQITVHPDGSSRVLDLELGSATLGDAMEKFGGLEGLALFEPKQGQLALEGFFGTVQLGPLKAKIIVGLEAEPAELGQMRDAAVKREGSPTGDWKYTLADAPRDHMHRRITVISYIPGTRNLDAGFLRERFGEPAATLRESEQAVSWFYPKLGLSILVDDEAREVFEYLPPRDFVMPDGVTPNPVYGS
ncbi:MAG: hypothetical protein KDI82_06300 [Gammaproteobacteria bacterium]|nr:hypothetical protein [Gammaproteobacteria bacterium]